MTIQVGMVGSDGVLLASDTRWTDESGVWREPWDQTKVKIDHKSGIAVSLSGKMITAGRLADAIIAEGNHDWLTSEIGGRQRIGDAVLSHVYPGTESCECLVVFMRPSMKLYRLKIAMIDKHWELLADPMLGKVFAGDCKNCAMFWVDRYYPHNPKGQ